MVDVTSWIDRVTRLGDVVLRVDGSGDSEGSDFFEVESSTFFPSEEKSVESRGLQR